MQHKQARRILLELASDRRTAAKMVLEIADILERPLPRLGPFKKNSADRILHKLASGKAHPLYRLQALRELLLSPSERQALKEISS